MKTVVLAGIMLALVACVTRKDLKALPHDSGLKATYKAPFDKVRFAVRDALGEVGFKPKEPEVHTDANHVMMIHSHGVTAHHSPRWARAILENAGEETHVWIVVWSKVDSRHAEVHDNSAAQDIHDRVEMRTKK